MKSNIMPLIFKYQNAPNDSHLPAEKVDKPEKKLKSEINIVKQEKQESEGHTYHSSVENKNKGKSKKIKKPSETKLRKFKLFK